MTSFDLIIFSSDGTNADAAGDQQTSDSQTSVQSKPSAPTRKLPASVPARQRALLMRIQKKEQLKQQEAEAEPESEEPEKDKKTNICK